MSDITTIKIFPSIGIMRLGNSPEYFVGPEIPGVRTPPPGGYKDAFCRIKRQAARFRLYGYDKDKKLVKDPATGKPLEINMNNAAVTWRVHLANKKASWVNYYKPGFATTGDRNSDYIGTRSDLEINAGLVPLSGKNQVAKFDKGEFVRPVGGKFTFVKVSLGEMRTDEDGRLLVLGGAGRSEAWPGYEQLTNSYDSPGWFDDVSDGPVTATVTIDGTEIPVDPAWVICGPPDYAPSLDTVTTLYDALYQTMRTRGLIVDPPKKSFVKHIYPTLKRVLDHRRLSRGPTNAPSKSRRR